MEREPNKPGADPRMRLKRTVNDGHARWSIKQRCEAFEDLLYGLLDLFYMDARGNCHLTILL